MSVKTKFMSSLLLAGSLLVSSLLQDSAYVQAAEKSIYKDERHQQTIESTEALLVPVYSFNAAEQGAWPEDLNELSRQLKPDSHEMAWKFEQFRYLKLLKRPIVTSGNLDVQIKNKGEDLSVHWKVLKPIASDFEIEGGKVRQFKNGEWKTLKVAEQPAFVFISKVMNQAMLGDFSALSEHFNLHWQSVAGENSKQEGEPWALGLEPKNAKSQLADMISSISLRGVWHADKNASLSKVVIIDARGELSLIELSLPQASQTDSPASE